MGLSNLSEGRKGDSRDGKGLHGGMLLENCLESENRRCQGTIAQMILQADASSLICDASKTASLDL